MTLLFQTIAGLPSLDPLIARQAQSLLDHKTKPPGSLGRLETLACRYCEIRGSAHPGFPKKTIVVMAGDHGVTDEAVSAYPADVTSQMLLNFAHDGAAINVLARHVGAEILVVDMGTRTVVDHPKILDRRIGTTTRNLSREAAMTPEEAIRALEAGIEIAEQIADRGCTLVGLGDMGIGNTTSAAALATVWCDSPPEDIAGRGTGIDEVQLAHKIEVIRRGVAVNCPDPNDPLEVLAKLGGFEIAGLAGVALGAARRRIPILIDGFISSVAGLAAVRLAPKVVDYLLPSHSSMERGHLHVLRALGVEPLFDLKMRLGEGTGAALAMSMVDASIRILHEMATFESAGVSRRS